MKMQTRYLMNKDLAVGSEMICPSCGTKSIKKYSQQSFCKTKDGTKCKDKYWNTVTETKRNNTTRISPANKAFKDKHFPKIENEDDYDADSDLSWAEDYIYKQ